MKRLLVFRHAKSSWDNPNLSDFERPLNDRGRKAAPFMGKLLLERDLLPDFILSSPAKRAKQTSKHFKKAAGLDREIKFDKRIYEASPNALVHIISETKDKHQSAMIVGHNTGFEDLVLALTGKYERMPTAAVAVVDFDVESWSEIRKGSGILIEVLRPREQKLRK